LQTWTNEDESYLLSKCGPWIPTKLCFRFWLWSNMVTPQGLGSLIHGAKSWKLFHICKSLCLMSCDSVHPLSCPVCWGWALLTHQWYRQAVNTDSICPEGFKSSTMAVIVAGCGFLLLYGTHKIVVMLL
jgi:hypothetical protein